MRFVPHCCLAPLVAALVCADANAAYDVERVVAGLNQPMFLTQAPGDNNHLYIVERTESNGSSIGRILAYNQLTHTSTTFLDVTGTSVSDGGLLSMTFHPDYATNGLFYTVSNASRINGLDEWRVVSGTPQLQRRLYQYENLQNVFHTLNQAMFRPGSNSELYVTSGDGGTQANSASFNPSLIEDPNSPFGKLLRFDLGGDFTTPAGGAAHPAVEVVALGLRNPYRSSFDRQTGDFYIGDVGFNAVEEVDFIPSSHFSNPAATPIDFGWTSREGTIATIGGTAGGPGSPSDVKPVFEYAHNSSVVLGHPSALNGGSITGGYVYRGPVSELQGRYFFADFTSQVVYSGVHNPATPVASYNGNNFTDLQRHDLDFETLIGGGANLQYLTSFSEDNYGNLYFVKFGNSFFPGAGQGEIFRIVATTEDQLELVVNRDTGALSLRNGATSTTAIQSISLSSMVGALSPAQITPVTGLRDISGDGTVDANNTWSLSSSTRFLVAEASTGDPGQLSPLSDLTYSVADGWVRSPFEDIAATVQLGDGTIVNARVSYVGNDGATFETGDLDFDGDLDRADFVVLAGQLHTDLAGLSPAQAYGRGDLNADGLSDYSDFQLFRNAYIAIHGEAGFAAIATVPEPFCGMLAASALSATFVAIRRKRGRCC